MSSPSELGVSLYPLLDFPVFSLNFPPIGILEPLGRILEGHIRLVFYLSSRGSWVFFKEGRRSIWFARFLRWCNRFRRILCRWFFFLDLWSRWLCRWSKGISSRRCVPLRLIAWFLASFELQLKAFLFLFGTKRIVGRSWLLVIFAQGLRELWSSIRLIPLSYFEEQLGCSLSGRSSRGWCLTWSFLEYFHSNRWQQVWEFVCSLVRSSW